MTAPLPPDIIELLDQLPAGERAAAEQAYRDTLRGCTLELREAFLDLWRSIAKARIG